MKMKSSVNGWWSGLFLCCFSSLGLTAPTQPEPDVAKYLEATRTEIERIGVRTRVQVPFEAVALIDAASNANWTLATRLFGELRKEHDAGRGVGGMRLDRSIWFRMQEIGGFSEVISTDGTFDIRLFANEIFRTVPDGAVYFGGTDVGRFVITVLNGARESGRLDTLTENQLADTNYLAYAQELYQGRLKLPGPADVNEAFREYLLDVQRRLDHDAKCPMEPKQVRPGEQISKVGDQLKVKGQAAVMEINGLLLIEILKRNPECDIYMEESLPIYTLWPYLSPIGPIFRVSHHSLQTITRDILLRNRAYWNSRLTSFLGFGLRDEIDLTELCAMAEKAKPFSSVARGVGRLGEGCGTRGAFAQCRKSQAGLYAWRASQALSTSEQRRFESEADIAFKQSYVLCPYDLALVRQYLIFLVESGRANDAEKLVTAAGKLNLHSPYMTNLVSYVQQALAH